MATVMGVLIVSFAVWGIADIFKGFGQSSLAKIGKSVEDIDLFELNEAFAAVGIASTAALGIDPEKVNVNGGAIALGHPVGMSGARIVLHLALELKRRGGGLGAAALCGGGGQGHALRGRRQHHDPDRERHR